MIESKDDLWNHFRKPGHIVCITTNGNINKQGLAIMGKGCAKEAADKVPSLQAYLGHLLQRYGNQVHCINDMGGNPIMFTIPTKHDWWDPSDPQLIAKSLFALRRLCGKLGFLENGTQIILPRPGCHNGGLQWKDVKPIVEEFLPEDNFVVVHKD